jgi:hypothetical protein
MSTLVTGAFGCLGAWIVRGLLSAGERGDIADLPRLQSVATSLEGGVRRTLDEFTRLRKEGRLDTRELA